MLRIETVNHFEGLRALESQWRALQDSLARTTVFQTWEWCCAWWEVFAERYERLSIGLVYAREELVMILPLVIGQDSAGRRSFFTLGTGLSDYADFIVRPGSEPQVSNILRRYMGQTGVRRLTAPYVPTWSGLYTAISQLYTRNQINLSAAPADLGERYAQVVLPASWEEYLASRSASHRKDIRHALRTVREAGFIISHRDQPTPTELDYMISLHCAGLAARKGTVSVFVDEINQRFLHVIVPRLLLSGQAYLFTIRDGPDTIVYFHLVLRSPHGFLLYWSGMDARYASYSPGVAGRAEIIQLGIAQQVRQVDLGLGDEGYKAKWANAYQPVLCDQLEMLTDLQAAARSVRQQVRLRTRVKNMLSRVSGRGGRRPGPPDASV